MKKIRGFVESELVKTYHEHVNYLMKKKSYYKRGFSDNQNILGVVTTTILEFSWDEGTPNNRRILDFPVKKKILKKIKNL